MLLAGIMKIKKIIYFTHFTFSKWDYERSGIEILKNNGFSVEVWDLTPFLNPEAYKTLKVPDPIDYKEHNFKLFKRNSEIINQITHLKSDTIIITLIVPDYRLYKVFKRLSKLNIPYALLLADALPKLKDVSDHNSRFNDKKLINYFRKIKDLNLLKIEKRISKKISFKLLKINFPELILAGGEQALSTSEPPIGQKTKIIWIHSVDYDLYLKDLLKPLKRNLEGEKYAVFIDEYLPFAHDYVYRGSKSPVTPERYYSLLCKFFSRVEKETGIEVFIAAHPSSMYEKHPDYFEGRRVIRGKTNELIRDSEFVLMHFSTSISSAILYNKPVLFFATKDIEQSKIDIGYIRAFSLELNKGYIKIDENYNIDWDKELKIDKEAYANYKEKYIKRKGTKEKFFWRTVADEIKKLGTLTKSV